MNIVLISCAVIALLIVIGEYVYKIGYQRGVIHAADECQKNVEDIRVLAEDEGYKRGFADGEKQGYQDGRRYEAIAQHNTRYIASKKGRVYGEEATEV